MRSLQGDARPDLFLFNTTSGQWYRMVHDGVDGFTAQASGTWWPGQAGAEFSYPVTEVWSPSWSLYPADFSGDGLSDLLLYDGATGAYVVAVGPEEGYQYSSGGWSVGWTPYIADLNGTGHDDVFLHDPTTGQWFQMTSVVTFSGVTFTAAGSGGWSLGWTIHPTDFNGDGRTDFLLYHPTSGVWYQARNLTLGDFAYTTGTWPANLTIVGGQTSQSGGQLPEPLPAPTPPLGADLEVFHTEAGPSGPADMLLRTEAGSFRPGVHAIEESPDGASPPFVEYEAPSPPPVDVTLTLDIAGTGSGTVTSSPSGLATCTGAARTCVGGFETGTVVTLTATAANGHEFTGWGGACKGTDTCTVMMADARYVAAHFRLIPAVGTSFYHLDTLNSVRAVTNAVGDVIRRDDYHAFGEAGTPPVGDPIRFTGKERDAETALDYFGARYYRNLTGRFTTADDPSFMDPFSPRSMNRYSYVTNNPARWVDPSGHQPQCATTYCETVTAPLINVKLIQWVADSLVGRDGMHPQRVGRPDRFDRVGGCAIDQLGLQDVVAAGLVGAGQPIPGSKRFRTKGSALGTSAARRLANHVFGDARFSVRVPTVVGLSIRMTPKVAAIAGRAVPVVGWGLLAYDAASIGVCSVR